MTIEKCKICGLDGIEDLCSKCRIVVDAQQTPNYLRKVKNYLLLNDNRPKLYVDMDNTLADFDGSEHLLNWDHKERPYEMFRRGFFSDLRPFPGAISAMKRITDSGKYNVYILSKPVLDSPRSFSEKQAWVMRHFPELADRLVLTQNKLLVDPNNAILIDDDNMWHEFKGEFILFDYLLQYLYEI